MINPVKREPILNIPGVVSALIVLFAVIHAMRVYLLSPLQRNAFDSVLAFNPLRYEQTALIGGPLPGGFGADIWTFVTYAFIHADLVHLAVNSVWLLPFGSAVARRFGPLRFVVFFLVTAAAGAFAHLLTHGGSSAWMVGASAAISGTMAAAMRFAFQRGGPLGFWRYSEDEAYRIPALPLSGVLQDARVLGFLAAWFAINLIFGLGSLTLSGGDDLIAWQAHIGGFLAGLLLFALFDPAPTQRGFGAG